MMSLVLPLYVSLLGDTPSSVHNHVLQQLMLVGPKYPAPFRSVMASSLLLKTKLEAAIKRSKTSTTPNKQSNKGTSHQQPAIQLKMDFSNFK